MSGMSEKILTVEIQMPAGTDISVTSATAAQVEALLKVNKEIKNYDTTVGASATSLMGAISTTGGGGENTATIDVHLDPGADMEKEAEALRLAIKEIAGGEGIAVSTSSASHGMGPPTSGLEVSIQGENQEALADTTNQLLALLQGVKGLANLDSELTMVVPKLDIKIDPVKVAALGLPPDQLLQEFNLLMEGSTVA